MNKYHNLLSQISKQYNIKKGLKETDNEFKIRIIYSICGLMAYASLWDNFEDSISISHLKRKISSTLANFKSMYNELSDELIIKSEDLEDEILDLFIKAGIVYHRPYKIAPSMKREVLFDNILFQRGVAIDDISCVSGLGFYKKEANIHSIDNIETMFALEQENLKTVWEKIISNATWDKNPSFEDKIEYLCIKPPFYYGYWLNTPTKDGSISILRIGIDGAKIYYLYRYVDNILEISPLPNWQVEEKNYIKLACACLYNYKSLPDITYIDDGALVYITLNYSLPPHEFTFLKLYSWPYICTKLPCDFKRKLSKDTFIVIKQILSSKGYGFREEIK